MDCDLSCIDKELLKETHRCNGLVDNFYGEGVGVEPMVSNGGR